MKRCPTCGKKLRVVDTREREKGRVKAENGAIYRRKECPACKKRFSTVEMWAEDAEMLFNDTKIARLEKITEAISNFIMDVAQV